MDEIVKEFLIESSENLDRLDQELVALESDPSSKDLLGSVFRTIHTIKGSCGFLGFPRLERITHTGEGLLARLRDSELCLNEEITSALLAMVDAVRSMLACIRDSGQDGEHDFGELVARLASLQKAAAESNAQAAGGGQANVHHPESPALESAKPEQTETPLPAETIRVEVKVLDRLMNLVGELVLARNQLVQSHPEERDRGLHATSQRLNLITGELQNEVMKARMQPISTVWNKFPRTVRDLALTCGKEVRLKMEGAEVELDRAILEAIRDPLVHLIRNAIDHGIEVPEVRQQAGKDRVGTLTLRAFHEAGRVNLDISDDGAGLNREKICGKAIERGLVSAQPAKNMPDNEIYQLIFRPGFSTAEKVTGISGRGVGMDVVKTKVESISGIVAVHSVPGQGTTFIIRIPLTLAIIPALMIRSGGERFAIPQANLVELVRLEGGGAKRIETIQGAAFYRLRGRLLPLVSLSYELQLPRTNDSRTGEEAPVSIVVVRADRHDFGIVVDDIMDNQEVVVKPLERQLKRIGVYAGTTILGDGRVALILDIHGLAQRAGLSAKEAPSMNALAECESQSTKDRSEPVLIVQGPDHNAKAIPLSVIWRLEEIPRAKIENIRTQEVIQYENEIMPLIRLGLNHAATARAETTLPIVVCQSQERKVGLVVERFLDIVDDNLVLQQIPAREFVLGAAVIQHQITEVLDVPRLIREQLPEPEASRRQAART